MPTQLVILVTLNLADLILTYNLYAHAALDELNPIAAGLLQATGYAGVVALKMCVLGFACGVFHIVAEHRHARIAIRCLNCAAAAVVITGATSNAAYYWHYYSVGEAVVPTLQAVTDCTALAFARG
ncbi:MAG: hypothetical protein JOZ53_15870 [Planctomycetaceae bacterium]|nr:hypothetical protein [Acetobacteraceae bacterium]MBV8316416.1 hypothetical protein [Planctomycetaceae bacterium]